MAGGQTTVDPSRVGDYTTGNPYGHEQVRPGATQTSLGHGFLQASTHSQELPLHDPMGRRLTQGSSGNTFEGRTSMLIEGTPNVLEGSKAP